MTLPPDQRRAGMTLFEVLIALAILSLITAVVIISRPAPSDRLVLQSRISELKAEAALTRQKAVSEDADVLWSPEASNCDAGSASVTFFADGTARGSDICLEHEGLSERLRIDVLSGHLIEIEQ